MDVNSVSEIVVRVRVQSKGEFEAKLFKHLSPVTLSRIRHLLPLSGRANFFERSFFYVLTNVIAGEEKSRFDFKEGDIAFMPAGSAICFFLKGTRSYKPMNLLGHVEGDLKLLREIQKGDLIQLRVLDQEAPEGEFSA